MSIGKKKKHQSPVGSGRGGRPKLEEAVRRQRRIGVPVNEAEDNTIGNKAALVHMKKGVFLRHPGLGKHIQRPVPAINYRAYRQLGRLATNFSYTLTLIEAGRTTGIERQLAERILDEIRGMQSQLLEGK